jgi:hypothetical protein
MLGKDMTLFRAIQYPYRRHILRYVHEWQFLWKYDIYRGRGSSQIRRIPDDKLALAVDLHLSKKAYRLAKQSIAQGIKSEASAYSDAIMEGLNAFEQAVHLTRLVDLEVRNGGFNQYYFNTQGIYEEATLHAYELIDARDYLAVFRAAAKQAHYSVEGHIAAHQQEDPTELMKNFAATYTDNPLNDVDSSYYDCSPEIDIVLATFIRKNADQFPKEKI